VQSAERLCRRTMPALESVTVWIRIAESPSAAVLQSFL
jgi:hypothetical protein